MITHTIKDLLSVAREHEQRKALGFIERSGMLICGALPPEEHRYLRGVKGFSDLTFGESGKVGERERVQSQLSAIEADDGDDAEVRHTVTP